MNFQKASHTSATFLSRQPLFNHHSRLDSETHMDSINSKYKYPVGNEGTMRNLEVSVVTETHHIRSHRANG